MHEGEPTERDRAVARVLSQVWLSSLIGWVGGVDGPEVVGDDLERAARMLVERRASAGRSSQAGEIGERVLVSGMATHYNFADLFEAIVDIVPDRTALVVGDTRRTFAEIEDRSNRLAHHLRDAGVERRATTSGSTRTTAPSGSRG